MQKRTNGPWFISRVNEKKQYVEISGHANDYLGCATWDGMIRIYGCEDYPEKGIEAAKANASLIAAAPELLEALKGLVAEFGDKSNSHANVSRAISAIAKAEGR